MTRYDVRAASKQHLDLYKVYKVLVWVYYTVLRILRLPQASTVHHFKHITEVLHTTIFLISLHSAISEMLSHLLNALTLLAPALSHPTSFPDIFPRQTFGGAGECYNEWVISTVTSDTTSWSPIVVADGESCTSDALEPCTVGQTFTKSFSITLEAGVDIDLYVPDPLPTVDELSTPSLLTHC